MAKILITDDSKFMRDMIGDIVTEAGHSVVHAASGEELLDKYVEEKPDIVNLDIVMIGLNGIDALDRLMELDGNAKVLICSAIIGQKPMIEEVIEKGAYDFIRKPFGVRDLLAAIERGLD